MVVIVMLALVLDNDAVGGVDLIAVLVTVGMEVHVIDGTSVILVELALPAVGVGGVHSGVSESGGLGLVGGDIGGSRGGRSGIGRGSGIGSGGTVVVIVMVFAVMRLAVTVEDLPGQGIYQTLKFGTTHVAELNLVYHTAVLEVQFPFPMGFHGNGGQLAQEMLPCCLHCGFCADVGLVAGLAGGGYVVQLQGAGLADEVQFIDRERSKIFEGIAGVLRHDLLDELGFAGGDAVLVCQSLQLAVGRDGLAEDRTLEAAGLKQGVDLTGQTGLQSLAALRVGIVHADQNGICQFVDIAVAEHGADEGVDGHVKVAALEIHIADDDFGILVEGDNVQHLFVFVYFDFNAGVDVQRDGGGHGVAGLPGSGTGAQRDDQGQYGGDGAEATGKILLVLRLCHRNYRSFLCFALRADGIQNVRGGAGVGALDLVVQFLFGHRGPLLS